jgi:hypothetical protein
MSEALRMLNSERQFPSAAACSAAADGREAEYARDVPRTCSCVHRWDRRLQRYLPVARMPGCPWHTTETGT